MKARFVVVWLR